MCRWAIIASTVKRPWAGQLKNNGSIPGPVQDFIIFSKASIPVLGPLTPLFTGYVGLFFSPGVKGQCMTPISSFYLVLKLRNIAVSPLTVVYITCSGTNLHCFLSSRIWCWNVDNVCVCVFLCFAWPTIVRYRMKDCIWRAKIRERQVCWRSWKFSSLKG